MKLSTFLLLNIMCWILRLSGENFRFLLFTVISVICVCILIVSFSVFLNWVCWARGNFSGEPGHVHIRVCGSLRCVECRAGTSIFWALCWCGWRDCTGFLFLWLCFGGYGTIEQVGVAGQYGSSVFLALFWRVRYNWNGGGGAVFNFSLSLVCCQAPWRVDMRGRDIALFFYGIL